MAKKKKTRPTNNNKNKKKPFLNYPILITIIFLSVIGYLGYLAISLDMETKTKDITHSKQQDFNYESQGRTINTIPLPDKKEVEDKKAKVPPEQTKQKEIKQILPPKSESIPNVKSKGSGKLVIIIDDVSTQAQLNQIKKIPFDITPSVFPPSELSSTSHNLAVNSNFMVHLPLESDSKKMNTMRGTLFVNATKDEIYARVKEIREHFPHAKFVNNHTGGKFTANKSAMSILYDALNTYGFVFVDSRTSKYTTVPQLAKQYNYRYIARDIFLDNIRTKEAVRKQLSLAVNKAKTDGYAIAIGHPYPVTLEVLRDARDILNGVDVVYIDKLYSGGW